jgi:hypothetical protein
VAVENEDVYVLAAILTEQIALGGHGSFTFHGAQSDLAQHDVIVEHPSGSNAGVDFIVPKREKRGIVFKRKNKRARDRVPS